MKSKKLVLCIMLVLSLALVLSGCQTSSYTAVLKDNVLEVSSQNSDKGFLSGSGTFEVAEGQQVVIESKLEKGELTLKFIPFSAAGDVNASSEDLEKAANSGNAAAEQVIKSAGTITLDIAPGDYNITVEANTDKTTGTLTVSAK